ncbi:MAG: cell wall hydrolase [Pseudomonadota bacterium]
MIRILISLALLSAWPAIAEEQIASVTPKVSVPFVGQPVPLQRPDGLWAYAAPDGPVPSPPLSPMNPNHPMDRALVCMARNIYYESRGQSREGQVAVGHVVLNRVKHRYYPNSVCRVIKQGGRNGPCQFSWYCDRHSNEPKNRKTYARMLDVALDVLSGEVADPTNGANMFHSTAVRPSWARKAQPRGKIGDHYFYYIRTR